MSVDIYAAKMTIERALKALDDNWETKSRDPQLAGALAAQKVSFDKFKEVAYDQPRAIYASILFLLSRDVNAVGHSAAAVCEPVSR